MQVAKVIVQIIYVLICIAIVFIVLRQESKDSGLSGALTGGSDTYWAKNKSRSVEGKLERATRYLGVAFIAISVLLNLNIW